MRRSFLVLGLSASVAACAGGPEPLDGRPAISPAAERGRHIAQRECGGCHGLGYRADSRRSAAPPFRDIRLRYNELMFQRAMAQIAEGGHYEMPPVRLEAGEVRDVAAYIESLRPR